MKDRLSLKDYTHEHRIYSRRVILMFFIVLLLSGVLLAQLFNLQYLQHEQYSTRSDKNRIRIHSIPPTRGLIYDRNGILIADNRPSYSLTIVKEHAKDMDKTLEKINEIIPLTDRELKKFRGRMREPRRPFESVPLLLGLTEDQIAKWAVNRFALPGVEVEAQLIRHYPLGPAVAHALGYVGRISKREKERLDADRYSGTNHIGKIGIEKEYEDLLLGEVGRQRVETNARGRVLKVLHREDPKPGRTLKLHLDSHLQLVAAEALADRRGAVVAIDTTNGGILALYSNPSFNSNLFVQGISTKDYSALRDSPDIPLFNRAVRGQYPPGSTVKPFYALAGLEFGVTNRMVKVYDPGWYRLDGDSRQYRDWKREGHGYVNITRAVVESCDIFFYDLAFKMGVDRMSPFLGAFGFGAHSALDVVDARRGILPSRKWKRDTYRQPWYIGDTINYGIGQGYMLATPLQLAAATAVLANRGVFKRPRYIDEIDGEPFVVTEEDKLKHPDVKIKNEDDWEFVINSMEDVVHSPRGTARKISEGISYRLAGKTGTAQVVGIAQGKKYDSEALKERNRDHALFVTFAPADDPKIAVAVIVENGESAGKTSAPISRKIIDAHLANYKPPQPDETEDPLLEENRG